MIAKRFFSVVRTLIENNLKVLEPNYLEVVDESWMHESSKETHFKLIVVSSQFNTLSTVKRNYLIYKHLEPVWDHNTVLLSITAKSPAEYTSYKSHKFVFEYPPH